MYNLEGKVVRRENLAGQVTAVEWDCCHKISETQSDGSTTTWDYDDDGRMIASSRLIPLDMTNVTWLTTCYEYDAHHRFVYDGYLCIQRLNAAANNSIDLVFGWDPSEPVATRPLILQKYGQYNLFYTHDGNKNVSELVFFQQANGIAAYYEYAPFGAVTAISRSMPVTAYDFRECNTFRFSSEYADAAVGLVYYNYRHYNPLVGNWCAKDPIGESGGVNLCGFIGNYVLSQTDYIGQGWTMRYGVPVFLYTQCCDGKEFDPAIECCIGKKKFSRNEEETGVSYYCHRTRLYYPIVQPIIRPFSPSQFMVDHCWFNVDGFRFGAYPNGRFEDKKSIRDESTMPSNYNTTHEDSF